MRHNLPATQSRERNLSRAHFEDAFFSSRTKSANVRVALNSDEKMNVIRRSTNCATVSFQPEHSAGEEFIHAPSGYPRQGIPHGPG